MPKWPHRSDGVLGKGGFFKGGQGSVRDRVEGEKRARAGKSGLRLVRAGRGGSGNRGDLAIAERRRCGAC
nr:hypothetical protein CFP56_22503 [Quercus suber]